MVNPSLCRNPGLCEAIMHKLGLVSVLRQGEPAKYTRVVSPYRLNGSTKYTVKIQSGGEEFQCRCPFCNDDRGHLYINHMYGAYTEDLGLNFPSLAYCHHGCLDNESNRIKLRAVLLGFGRFGKRGFALNKVAKATMPEPSKAEPVDNVMSLKELNPDHSAIKYLVEDRKYSLDLLSEFGVGFCPLSKRWKYISGCIIIPVYFKGEYAGWQARYIGKPPDGYPKYYTQPGFRKSLLLYNYDMACKEPYIVVVEGATDVWRVGKAGVCGFGKRLSDKQKDLLAEAKKPIAVFLDPDAQTEAEALCSALKERGCEVYNIVIPESFCKNTEKTDPGSLTSEEISDLVKGALNGNQVS